MNDSVDRLMERGRFFRQLRALELEAERGDDDVSNENQNDDHGDITRLVTGDTILCYDSYLTHQRYHDDLKHVDCQFIDYGKFDTQSRLVVEQDKGLGKGGICWDAAFILGEYMIDTLMKQESSVNNPINILELGCGTGLCGLMVAKAVPHVKVELTDLPELMPLVARNVARNFPNNSSKDDNDAIREYMSQDAITRHVRGSVSASVLSWGSNEQQLGTFDIVLGADVVATLYDPVALVETICNVSNNTTRVFISFKERQSSIHRQFEDAMRQRFNHVSLSQSTKSRNRNPDVQILVASDRKR